MATTNVLTQKYAKTFDQFDANGSGTVDTQDLEVLIDRVTGQFQVEPGSKRHKAFADACHRVWAALLRETGKDGEITRDEYVGMLEQATDATIEAVFDPYIDGMFALADTDGDGRVTKEEFEAHQRGWGLSAAEVRGSFEELDTDRDGILSRAEYAKYMHQYFESGDPNARGNALSGT